MNMSVLWCDRNQVGLLGARTFNGSNCETLYYRNNIPVMTTLSCLFYFYFFFKLLLFLFKSSLGSGLGFLNAIYGPESIYCSVFPLRGILFLK